MSTSVDENSGGGECGETNVQEANNSSDPHALTNPKGLPIPALTALVVGSMIGGGIFGLPSQMARVAAPGPLVIGWVITAVGMLTLAFAFQSLANRFPQIDGGVYGYARAGFGNYIGYCSAIGYWIGAWIGNVAFLVLLGASFGTFFPSFGAGNTVPAIIFASVVLWIVHFLVLRGVHEAAFVNVIVTIAKIVPLTVFIVVAVFFFKWELLATDFWGTSTMVQLEGAKDLSPLGGMSTQIIGMMLITVWVFSGVEGASVFSNRARRRSDVGKATVIGFLFVLALLVLVNLMSYAAMAQTDISKLQDPSLAGVFAQMVGPWGAKFVSIGLIISLMGVLLSWVLLCTEILRIPSGEGIIPKRVGALNPHGTPTVALWMSNICVQATLIVTLFSEKTYEFLILLASGTILIPYLWVALYQLLSAVQRKGLGAQPKGGAIAYELVIGLMASAYAIWLLYAGKEYILPSIAVYFGLTALFVIARREVGDNKVFKPAEWAVFAVMGVGTAVFMWQVVTGQVTL